MDHGCNLLYRRWSGTNLRQIGATGARYDSVFVLVLDLVILPEFSKHSPESHNSKQRGYGGLS